MGARPPPPIQLRRKRRGNTDRTRKKQFASDGGTDPARDSPKYKNPTWPLPSRQRGVGSNEIVFVIEPDVGRVTVEILEANCRGSRPRSREKSKPELRKAGRKGKIFTDPADWIDETEPYQFRRISIWLYRVYHNSVVDGAGRRSVVQVSGCSIRCTGCHVPHTHRRDNGTPTPIHVIVDEIAKHDAHEGATILGGELFDQPGAEAELVSRLTRQGLHIAIHSGYTFESLIGRKNPNIDFILTQIDMFIVGPLKTNYWPGVRRTWKGTATAARGRSSASSGRCAN